MPSFDFDDLKEKGAELIQKVKDSEVVSKGERRQSVGKD